MRHKNNIFTIKYQPFQTRSKQHGKLLKKKKKKKNSGNSQSCNTITKINCGDKLLNNSKEIANAFNKFHTQIVTNSNINTVICTKPHHY